MGRRVLRFDGPLGRGLWYRPSGDKFCNSAPRNGKPYNRASPAGRFPGFIIMAPFIFKGAHHRCRQAAYILAAEPPPQPSAAKPLSNLRTIGANAPSILRTLSLTSEPARSVGGTHRSVRQHMTDRTRAPKAPEPFLLGGKRTAESRQPSTVPPSHKKSTGLRRCSFFTILFHGYPRYSGQPPA